MATNRYTRTFSDFGNYPWPGKIMPEFFEQGNYEDGYRGTQGMSHGIISSYGAYHIVEGASPTIASTQWTGTTAYAMMSGIMKSFGAASGILSAAGSSLIYNQAGSWAVTGAKPTGLVLATNIKGTVYTVYKREDINSKTYFPNDIYVYGSSKLYGDVTGNLDTISGFDGVSANSGIFATLQGFSNIAMKDSLDFESTYYIKNVAQITGTSGVVGNSLGTTAIYTELTGTNFKTTTAVITQVTGTYTTTAQLTGTSGVIGDLQVTTINLLPVGALMMYDGTALGGTISTRATQIGDEAGDPDMPGWYVCNGYASTPNLINKFIRGSATRGSSGGSDTHTLTTAEMPIHAHTNTVGNQSASHQHVVDNESAHTHALSLRNDAFGSQIYVRASGPSTQTAGATAAGSAHKHTMQNQSASHNHTVTINNAGSGNAHINIPAYYTVVYIKRMS